MTKAPIATPISVLVTGAGGVYGEATVQNLRASSLVGLRIYAADTRWHAAGSLRADVPLVLPRVNDPAYVTRVTEIVKSNGIRAVFICSGTEINALLDRRDELEEQSGALFIMPSAALYRMASDKLDTVRFLEAHGIDHPITVAATDSDAAIDAFVKDVGGFPVIAKPRRGQGSRGLMVCRSREQLRKVKAFEEDYVFQQHLGDDDHEYTVGVIANEAGDIFGGSIVLRRWLAGGQTSASEVVHSPEITAYAEGIAKVAMPRGYINVQLRMREGKPVCFEINARVSSSTGFRALAGFNEPELILRRYLLDETPPERIVPRKIAMVRGLAVSIVDPSIWDRVVPPA